MNRTYLFLAAGLMGHAALIAQTQPGVPAASQFQPAQSMGTARGGGRGAAVPLPREEKGKPFSATVTSQTTQTLTDGTRVSQVTTMVQYRDTEGRVRTETTQPDPSGSGQMKVITIRDPVAGVSYRLDPAKKSAVKLGMPGVLSLVPTAVGARDGGGGGGAPQAPAQGWQETSGSVQMARPTSAAGGGGRGGGGARGGVAQTPSEPDAAALQAIRQKVELASQAGQAARKNPNETIEDLGTLTVNGVPAAGTRTTTVVPVGAIGNDREFRSVSERWFSSDLNLLIKSVNTDPRFGTSTYEVTNISRQPPDSSLFQVPVDYTIVSPGGGQPF